MMYVSCVCPLVHAQVSFSALQVTLSSRWHLAALSVLEDARGFEGLFLSRKVRKEGQLCNTGCIVHSSCATEACGLPSWGLES